MAYQPHTAIPSNASDVLMHVKDSYNTERIEFPFTRYANVLCAPNLITDVDEHPGAPFHLLKIDTAVYTRKELKTIFGNAVAFGEPDEYYKEEAKPEEDTLPKFVVSYNRPSHECVWIERLSTE